MAERTAALARINDELSREVAEHKRAEKALQQAQAELTRVARLTTMGELVASIAHEINQPLTGVVANGGACLRWLNRDKPALDEARNALARVISDGIRAGDVIHGLRALTKKSGPELAMLDINDAIREVQTLTRSELQQQGVTLHTDLSANARPVFGGAAQSSPPMKGACGYRRTRCAALTSVSLCLADRRVESAGLVMAEPETEPSPGTARAGRMRPPCVGNGISDGRGN